MLPNHRRVVVTGAGIITPLGTGWLSNQDGFRNGKQAFGPVSLFDASRQRTRIAAEVVLPAIPPVSRLSIREFNRIDRAGEMLLWAAIEAWQQSGWVATEEEIPIVLGTTSGGMTLGQDFYRQAFGAGLSTRLQSTRITHYQPQRQALDVMDALGFSGPVSIIANACASGSNAIGHAFEMIRSGQYTRAVSGGYDAISQLVFAGFDSLQALSPTGARPFHLRRDGLTLGEGAAVLCLEELDSALNRGAQIHGEIMGYGSATDVSHLTQPHPDGDAALATMQAACKMGRVEPRDIGYLNAHGTGTLLNDSSEARAIARWAGDDARNLSVSSTKAGIGHLLGAAGAIEAVVCLMALAGQWLPPQGTTEEVDPNCNFPLVVCPQDKQFNLALSNSFGFGGANASLLFGRRI
jgi:3-oxoacyl-[acyl-carrier-protein] synthase II